MATIRKRIGARGVRFQAIIRRRHIPTRRYRETQTFGTRAEAESWAHEREDALNDPVASVRSPTVSSGPALGTLIRWYIDSFSALTPWGRTKQTALEFLERHPIGQINAPSLTTALLVDHIRSRRAGGATAATAGNDLTWIGCVPRAAQDCDECARVNPAVVDQARLLCHLLHLIVRSQRRQIRPTLEQLDQLTEYFRRRDQRSQIPMTEYSVVCRAFRASASRVVRLRWSDHDPQHRTGLVRDAKHPLRTAGNHRRFKYTPEAWDIATRQPKTSEFIFPYKAQSIGTASPGLATCSASST